MNQCNPAGGHASAGFFLPAPRGYDNAMPAELTEIEFIVVDDTAAARAALQAAALAGRKVMLVSPPATSAAMGPGVFAESIVQAKAGLEHALAGAVFDCGDAAGLAMAALRLGGIDVLADLPDDTAGKIAELAAAHGRRAWRRGADGLMLSTLPGEPA